MRLRLLVPLTAAALLAPAVSHAGAPEGSGEPIPASAATPPAAAPHTVLGAALPPRTPRAQTWDLWGSASAKAVRWSDPPLDTAGTTSGRERWFDSRLLAGGAWVPSQAFRLDVEVEALSGQFAGDETAIGTSLDEDAYRDRRDEPFALGTILPRRAAVTWRGDFGQFVVGQQVSSFGLGMLANDGTGSGSVFGDARQGSLVERVAYGVAPFARSADAGPLARGLVLYVSGDLVFRDDNASLLDGDEAWVANAGVRVETDAYQFAVAQSARFQTDRRDPRYPEPGRTHVEAHSTAGFGRVRLWRDAASERQIVLEAEGAVTLGHTDRSYLDETYEDGSDIRSMGGVARLRYDCDRAHLTARLEAGYASGDNDPRDAVARQFSFHSDYNVGLVLFDHYLPMITGRPVDRIADPDLIAVAPGSTRFTINQGTVQNAAYLYPTIQFRPIVGLDLRLGWLLVRAAGDLIDPYLSGLDAGYNTTWGGKSPGSRELGQEFDAGASWTLSMAKGTAVRLGGEGGVFLPGAAFDGVGGPGPDNAWLVRGTVAVEW
jgi:hypothetical protein